RGPRGPGRRAAGDPGLDGWGRDEAGRSAESVADRVPRLHVPPVLRLRGRRDHRVRGRPHADGHERAAERDPSAGLLLEDLGPEVRGFPDAGLQVTAWVQGPVRY